MPFGEAIAQPLREALVVGVLHAQDGLFHRPTVEAEAQGGVERRPVLPARGALVVLKRERPDRSRAARAGNVRVGEEVQRAAWTEVVPVQRRRVANQTARREDEIEQRGEGSENVHVTTPTMASRTGGPSARVRNTSPVAASAG